MACSRSALAGTSQQHCSADLASATNGQGEAGGGEASGEGGRQGGGAGGGGKPSTASARRRGERGSKAVPSPGCRSCRPKPGAPRTGAARERSRNWHRAHPRRCGRRRPGRPRCRVQTWGESGAWPRRPLLQREPPRLGSPQNQEMLRASWREARRSCRLRPAHPGRRGGRTERRSAGRWARRPAPRRLRPGEPACAFAEAPSRERRRQPARCQESGRVLACTRPSPRAGRVGRAVTALSRSSTEYLRRESRQRLEANAAASSQPRTREPPTRLGAVRAE